MEKQITFSEIDYQFRRKKTQKEIFLGKMEKVVPLKEWCDVIRPFYYRNGNGRQPIDLEIMLKMYLISSWYNLSDEQTEDMLCENMAVRNYVGIIHDAPDATTLGKFRVNIIEKNNINKELFEDLNKKFSENKVIFHEGTIVDATIIDAPNSTKNKDKKANPEMSSTYKHGKNSFGMKVHIGMDKKSGLVHTAIVTTAKVADIAMTNELLHGEETEIYGDSGYAGIDKRPEICKRFSDGTGEVEKINASIRLGKNKFTSEIRYILKKKTNIKFHINKKRNLLTEDDKIPEKEKSKVRMKVEHAFGKLKHIFGFRKTRLRTIEKNQNAMYLIFTLVNILSCAQNKLSII